jgi:hypothetical protein
MADVLKIAILRATHWVANPGDGSDPQAGEVANLFAWSNSHRSPFDTSAP